MIGGGGGLSTLLSEEPEVVVVISFPEAVSDGVKVEDESRVDFLETSVEVERDSAGDA